MHAVSKHHRIHIYGEELIKAYGNYSFPVKMSLNSLLNSVHSVRRSGLAPYALSALPNVYKVCVHRVITFIKQFKMPKV